MQRDYSYIRRIANRALYSFKNFERFTVFLESEATRIEAKDIKSVADDISAIQKLSIESDTYLIEAETHAKDGDLLEILKTAEKVKSIFEKIKDLEYLTDITPEIFYQQYRAVFETSGETKLPDDLEHEMKDLFNKLVNRSLKDCIKQQQSTINSLIEKVN